MKLSTRLVHLGRDSEAFNGLVNIPPCRTSTFLHSSVAAYRAAATAKMDALYYGRFGTQTSKALANALADMDKGHGAVLYPSGLAAIAQALMAFLDSGDHLLMPDSVYGPVRVLCDKELTRRGVNISWYPPEVAGEIADWIKPETRILYLESPGSMTFDMQDIPAMTTVARQHGITTIADNTWATPVFCRPLDLGVDVAIQSASKYLIGHSDAMMGVAVARQPELQVLESYAALYGNTVSADDCYMALRGLRTLETRLKQHNEGALQVAKWLQTRTEVRKVLYPALPSGPGHDLWLRDYQGASGLLGIYLDAPNQDAVDAFIDALALFGIGVSWGGYESLALPGPPPGNMQDDTNKTGFLVRLHIGLEAPEDLIADLKQSMDKSLRNSHDRKEIV